MSFIKWHIWNILALTLSMACFLLPSSTPSDEQSQHWKNDCTLIETNIDRGFFSEPQHKLQCGGVTENVRAKEYDWVMGKDKTEVGYKTMSEFFEDI